MSETDFKLIYILKIGYHSNGEGLYEFIFSKDPSSVDAEAWGWNVMPANGNAEAPKDRYIDKILELKTDKIELTCLHELNDRTYMDGYYTIHALAFQELNDDSGDGDLVYDELPILVFHFGMKLNEVKDILYTRDLLFHEKIPTKTIPVTIDDEEEEDDLQMIV